MKPGDRTPGNTGHLPLVALVTLTAGLCMVAVASADTRLTISVENLAPANGTFLTPVWIGLHDGSFDLYDSGASAAGFGGLESLAEDGNAGPLDGRFDGTQASGVRGLILGLADTAGPVDPGETATAMFDVDGAANPYFSYAAMVIPSNDAFIANGDPQGHRLFDGAGNFMGPQTILVLGSSVLDAGTEVNDEIPANTAFLAQAAPNTGTTEGGTVGAHPGFMAPGSGGILDNASFAGADFTAGGYQVARITITPEPTTGLLLVVAAGLCWARRERRSRTRTSA